jgi:hypothetical protein
MIPISDLVKVKTDTLQKTIYRKDQKRVVYEAAMAGAMETLFMPFWNDRKTV